ncbi:TIGR03016 family PEP-CTERM system-associated outer membrane protein [Geobacter grbiciae]|uniref:TIGR03016 family PEP-CTERM system-associated outer membrane protein n=1 Tax=Geobacter grbiciae TaxID=155042 RepID=UPI001C031C4B|nr:TIGR03016 family PEP-CTERM system-associated outer membrane protein [Geobacter grbiciae]MBT1074675.1 TIGR03016 family PEP-CTERM system-associated outer membrane protein [Geobacter grbiciae]
MRKLVLGGMLASWCAATAAHAELKLTPNLTIREEYNDNIDLTNENRRDDFITTIVPSLNALIDTNLLKLNLDYGLYFKLFAKHSEKDDTSLARTQRIRLDSTFNPIRDILFLKMSDVYARVPIDDRRQVAVGNDFVNTTDSNIFTANPYLVYPITSSISLTAGYTYKNTWYNDPLGQSAQDHTVTGRLTKSFGERLSIYGEYAYRTHLPKDNFRNNMEFNSLYPVTINGMTGILDAEQLSEQSTGWYGYDTHTGMVGAVLQVTPKLTLNGSVGKTYYYYKSGTQTELRHLYDFVTGAYKGDNLSTQQISPANTNSLIWNAQANYLLSDRFSLEAHYSRDFTDSVDQGVYKRDTVGGSVKYNHAIEAALGGFYTTSKYETEDRKDTSTGATMTARIPLGANLAANLLGNYTHYKFSPDNVTPITEKVNRYSAQAGLDYTFRIMTMGLGYTWNFNDSNVEAHDYFNNIVWLQARLTY